MEPYFYISHESVFGAFSIVWREMNGGPRVWRVFLPRGGASGEEWMQASLTGSRRQSDPAIAAFGERIGAFLGGEPITFGLGNIDLERCSAFQQRVLLAEHAIPRGWVSTYGRIARHLCMPGAARAVGSALAGNPFPIIIPCHRVVRSGGELGGYQGGERMKRVFLEREGVEFTASGRVVMRRVCYL
jgi:methylated-DNA-[protein]-cysteine S-methyltransferase